MQHESSTEQLQPHPATPKQLESKTIELYPELFVVKQRSIICNQQAVLSIWTSQVRRWELHESDSKYICHLGTRLVENMEQQSLSMTQE